MRTGVTAHISHIYKGINAMLIIRGPIKPYSELKSSWLFEKGKGTQLQRQRQFQGQRQKQRRQENN